MSTKTEAFCTVADLQDHVPNIAGFDKKRRISGWEEHSAEKVWVSYDCGYVVQLYLDGEDLGDPEAELIDLDADGKWIYDADTDAVYLYSGADDPDGTHIIEAGQDWADAHTRARSRASDVLRSFVAKPIIKRPKSDQTTGLRDWDECVIEASAKLACSYLVANEDPPLAERLRSEVLAEETDPPGVAVMIRDGKMRLWNEAGNETQQGLATEVSVDASTTGGIADVRGRANVAWDVVKIVIETGGIFTPGTASPVTYSVYVGSEAGLKLSQVVNSQTINGQYQTLAHGLQVKFAPGVYVAEDEWELEVNGQPSETHTRSAPIRRF